MQISEEQIQKLKYIYAEINLDYNQSREEALALADFVCQHKDIDFTALAADLHGAVNAIDNTEVHLRRLHLISQIFEILGVKLSTKELEELKQDL